MSNQEDIRFLKDPGSWINWPVMPVKKYGGQGGWPKTGIVVDGGGPVVYEKNMFELVTGPIMEQVADSTKHEYPTMEAMVADGWVVD